MDRKGNINTRAISQPANESITTQDYGNSTQIFLKNTEAPAPWSILIDEFADRWPRYEEPVIIYH